MKPLSVDTEKKKDCVDFRIIKELIQFHSYMTKTHWYAFIMLISKLAKQKAQQTESNQRGCLVETEMNCVF